MKAHKLILTWESDDEMELLRLWSEIRCLFDAALIPQPKYIQEDK